jgi:hypothetical protein
LGDVPVGEGGYGMSKQFLRKQLNIRSKFENGTSRIRSGSTFLSASIFYKILFSVKLNITLQSRKVAVDAAGIANFGQFTI